MDSVLHKQPMGVKPQTLMLMIDEIYYPNSEENVDLSTHLVENQTKRRKASLTNLFSR